jgi:hypothetical protein
LSPRWSKKDGPREKKGRIWNNCYNFNLEQKVGVEAHALFYATQETYIVGLGLAQAKHCETLPIWKMSKVKSVGCMAQVVEHFSTKNKAMSTNISNAKWKKESHSYFSHIKFISREMNPYSRGGKSSSTEWKEEYQRICGHISQVRHVLCWHLGKTENKDKVHMRFWTLFSYIWIKKENESDL